ncbi:MAG TPA: hypothetical protein VNZ93_13375, partial [Pseudorhodoplanes sp.]|nr:hypothetical protein [Pseudorhodoplanes sp.]
VTHHQLSFAAPGQVMPRSPHGAKRNAGPPAPDFAALIRATLAAPRKDMDGRVKPGHDDDIDRHTS